MTRPANRSIDYGNLMHRAMRGLIQQVLTRVAAEGLPGKHHFFITFDTMHPDVEIADWLSDRYPGEMTIVIQSIAFSMYSEMPTVVQSTPFSIATMRLNILHQWCEPVPHCVIALLPEWIPSPPFSEVMHPEIVEPVPAVMPATELEETMQSEIMAAPATSRPPRR